MYDLNDLTVDRGDVTLTSAAAINDSGQIVASASDGHAYLLTPSSNYAVLFSGSNEAEFTQEIERMWNICKNQLGYAEEDIYILFADGSGLDATITNSKTHIEAATKENLKALLSGLVMTEESTFYFYSSGDGGNEDRPTTLSSDNVFLSRLE